MRLGQPIRLLYALPDTPDPVAIDDDAIWRSVPAHSRPILRTVRGIGSGRYGAGFPGAVIRPPESVRGWRVWRLDRDPSGQPVLASITAGYRWEGPSGFDVDPPTWGFCMGQLHTGKPGFHAFNDPSVLSMVTGGRPTRFGSTMVAGECELFGLIVEHVDGYRAQGMVIRHLSYHEPFGYPGGPRGEELRRALEERYQCDVEVEHHRPRPVEREAGFEPPEPPVDWRRGFPALLHRARMIAAETEARQRRLAAKP